MNDESSPESPVPVSRRNPDADPVLPARDRSLRNGGSSRRVRQRRGRRSRKPNNAISRKLQFMAHLLKTLDTLVCAEIGTLYYMECSFTRFALRFMTHYLFLTPKPEAIKLPFPTRSAYVAAIVVPNIICVLFHLFAALPYGSESSHGYLHGGVLVDFVGQAPPKARISLLLIDFFILGIQALMYAVHTERETIRLNIGPPNLLNLSLERSLGFTLVQNHDAEERGVHRNFSESRAHETDEDGIELGLLPPVDGPTPLEQSGTEQSHPSQPPSRPRSSMDIFASGNGFLGEFHVLHTLGRATSRETEASTAPSLRDSAAFARFVSRRQAQLRRG